MDMATLSTNRNSRKRSQPSLVSPRLLPCALVLGFGFLLTACGRTAAVSTGSSSTSGSPPPAAIAVSISPLTATVSTGGAQVFTATVTGAGNATTNVTWSVDGIANGNAALGTIAGSGASSNSPTGLYTAPATLPSPAVVTVTATSVADASKSASASVTIVCASPSSISPAAIFLALGQTQVFTASLCIPVGTVVAWDVNRISNGNSSVGAITIVSANSALYTAPPAIPAANPVTIHATAAPAGGSPTTASATVTLTSALSVSISPPTATLAPSQLLAFTATVLNASDTSVTWTVNGIPNGNATAGQICVSANKSVRVAVVASLWNS